MIVQNYSHQYSHWNSVKSLSEWLKDEGVPALYGIDTRMLTKKVRDMVRGWFHKDRFQEQPLPIGSLCIDLEWV